MTLRFYLVFSFAFVAHANATSLLHIGSQNPRYFTDDSGKVIYLAGLHERNNSQDSLNGLILDYSTYLAVLERNKHNFIRYWATDNSKRRDGAGNISSTITPLPYLRSGQGIAQDGLSKFDLTQFNQLYFNQLRSRVIDAGNRGIYVSIMLFNGWSVDCGSKNPGACAWVWSPYNSLNNINGIDGDINGDGEGMDIQELKIPAVTSLQEGYVRKVIDTVNDLDNVLYEICNECMGGTDNTNWQYYMINFIKSYEAGKPKQHPVGMTLQFPLSDDAALFSSPADWISPGEGNYVSDPIAADGRKVIIADTDHIDAFGVNINSAWVWKIFLRGSNPIVIDGNLNGFGFPAGSGYREAIGHTSGYAKRINLAAMTPSTSLCSTTYCLVNSGNEYLVYAPGGGWFSVNLQSGTYSYEWFNPTSGSVSTTGNYSAFCGNNSFFPPFLGDAVLYLKREALTALGGGSLELFCKTSE